MQKFCNAELHHCDCISIIKKLPNSYVDAIITDPPYGLTEYKVQDLLFAWSNDINYNIKGFKDNKWDKIPSPKYWRELYRVLKENGIVVCFGSPRTWDLISLSIRLGGFEIFDSIAWLHNGGMPKSKGLLRPSFEPIILARKSISAKLDTNNCKIGNEELVINRWSDGMKPFGDGAGHKYIPTKSIGRYPRNVIVDEYAKKQIDIQRGSETKFIYCIKGAKNTHPTEKPLELLRYLVKLVSKENGIILDPFMGSGTTGIACVHEKREFIGMEMLKEYYDLAINKFIEYEDGGNT